MRGRSGSFVAFWNEILAAGEDEGGGVFPGVPRVSFLGLGGLSDGGLLGAGTRSRAPPGPVGGAGVLTALGGQSW